MRTKRRRLQPPAAVLGTHPNRRWNGENSLLCRLPNTLLHRITTGVGKESRIVCQHLREAYGSPGSRLMLELAAGLASSGQDPMAILVAQLRKWQWPDDIQHLELPPHASFDLGTRKQVAAMLPHLRRLACAVDDCSPHASPTFSALTALTCTILAAGDAPAVPFVTPRLQQLQLTVNHPTDDDSISLTSLMRSFHGLTTLTCLHIEAGCGFQPFVEFHAPDLANALSSLASPLATLHVSEVFARSSALLPAAPHLRSLQDLTLGSWPRSMPPLPELPRLTRLDLQYEASWDDKAGTEDLAVWLSQGTTVLRSLTLPRWVCLEHEGKDETRVVLQGAGSQLPALTHLSVANILEPCCGDRWDDGGRVTGAWLEDLIQISSLQSLCVKLDVEEMRQLSVLQPLSALTSLQVVVADGERELPRYVYGWGDVSDADSFCGDDQDLQAVQPGCLAGLTSLRKLSLSSEAAIAHDERHAKDSSCHYSLPIETVFIIGKWCLQQCVGLTCLEELDVVDLGPLLECRVFGEQLSVLAGCQFAGGRKCRLVVHGRSMMEAARSLLGGIFDIDPAVLLPVTGPAAA